jgi:hypothetical protein
MILLGHNSLDELERSADDLSGMPPAARRLLATLVQEGELIRQKASPSAEALYDAGFLFIRERGRGLFDEGVMLVASLAGEEALDCLDARCVKVQEAGTR